MVSERAENLDLPRAQATVEDESAQSVVGGPALVDATQHVHDRARVRGQRADHAGACARLELVDVALLAVGQGHRHRHFFGHVETQVRKRAENLGKHQGLPGEDLERGLFGGTRQRAGVEAIAQQFKALDVLGDLLRRGHLAINAAPRLAPDITVEETTAFRLAEVPDHLQGDPVAPGVRLARRDLFRSFDVHRLLDVISVEVEDDDRGVSKVRRAHEGDGTEGLSVLLGEIAFHLPGVAQS